MESPHQVITIIGPIASGKTTAAQILHEHLDLPLLDADLFEENPFLPSYVSDVSRWSFATELFFTISRMKKLRELSSLVTRSSVLVDSGLIMSHQVYAKNHLVQGTMTAAEWEFFTQIIADYKASIPDPTMVIHLTADPQLQLKRIKKRGRSFEADYTLEYLEQITDRLNEYAESIQHDETVELISLDTSVYDLTLPKGRNRLEALVSERL